MLWCAGERAAIYVGPVPEDKLPKDATPGRILTGTLALAKKADGNGEAPGKVPLRYMCALLLTCERQRSHAATLSSASVLCSGHDVMPVHWRLPDSPETRS
jgi:hypothetical protein